MNEDSKLIKLLNNPDKVVGTRQVLRGLSEGTIRCVVVASDADAEMIAKIAAHARKKGAEVLVAPSMAWLGYRSGIEVRAAAVGIVSEEEIH